MRKRIFSILLTIAVCLSMMPAGVWAGEAGTHTAHCVCGKDNTTVKGHTTHSTDTTWTAANSLPNSAGSYYLTQSVSGNWTVPEGEVNLCLNGQTINGKITVGSGATLTLTDCSDTGKLQGSSSGSGVSINGGTFNLYGGTITGFVNGVEIGSHNAIKTGSSFTMYGGAITSNEAGSSAGGGVFLIGTTNSGVTAPSFTMHGGTISNNTAGASDGGGGGVYVGEKCSFTMDGGTITGNTATKGNGGGIYIHFNAGRVSISNATITDNKATATGNTSYGHGGGIYSERGVTVGNVKITGNYSTFEGGGIYGKGAITLTDATVTGNNHYDVYYDGKESTTPELTVSGSVKAGYYANFAWKLPIFVSGELSEDSVIRVGVREGIKPGYGESLAIAEPASGVTLRAENFKADAADSVTSLGEDGKVYLSPCNHEMDNTGYTCKKCHTQFDVRIGESAYYQTLAKAFLNARDGSTITLMRDVNLKQSCSASDIITLDLHGKTITSGDNFFNVNEKLTVKDSSEGGGTQALNVKFNSNGTLAVDDSYTGDISYVALRTGGTLEAYTGTIQELRLEKSTGTGYSVKLWKDNAHCCTVKTITLAENANQNLTVGDLLETNHAKCELYGEQDGTWSIIDKSTKIVNLTGYTAYKVQFAECVHQCDNDTVEKPVCSKCGKVLVVKITATASDGTIKTAWFPADSGIENGDGYVEAIQTLNGWSAEGYTDATLMPLCDVHDNRGGIGIARVTLTGKLAVDGGEHLIYSTTIAAGADVTFKTGRFYYITVNGKASFVGGTYLGLVTASSGAEAVFSGGAYQYLNVEDGGTAVVKNSAAFGEDVAVTKGTLTVEGGSFGAAVVVERDGTMNVNGGSFTGTERDKVTYGSGAKGTVSGGSFAELYLYGSGTAWLAGGSFTKLSSSDVLSSLLADGAAYYDQSGNAISNSGVSELNNVTVKTHTHTVDEQTGICSVCKKQMAASLTVGGTTSWYAAFATAVEAANAADGEKTITLYQDVNGYVDGHSTTYELTRGPVTLATGGKMVTRVNLIAKGISLTVTGSNGDFNVTVDGRDAELTVNDKDTKLAIVTAQNGGKLSLSNGTFSRVAVKDDGSSASLSGGSYDEITSDTGYVKPYALLAEGYAYKRTKDNQWLPNANSIPSEVTVEKAPFAVEKIYPNNDTNYTGSSAIADDGNITLTAVIAPETEDVTYYYWWELFNESKNDWTTRFSNVNTATHTGGQSKTLTISGLPVGNSYYQYRILVQCSNGYNCYSEPFTVTRHQHSWTYTASDATITATCSKCSASGGSVTINKPAHTTYGDGQSEKATLTENSWQGLAVTENDITYKKDGVDLSGAPTDAGTYTASITLDGVTASVEYTIAKATPKASDFIFAAPADLTYDGNAKTATVTPNTGINGMGAVTVKYLKGDGEASEVKDAGDYAVKVSVADGDNYNATDLMDESWYFTIGKAGQTITVPENKTIVKNGKEVDISGWATVSGVEGDTSLGTLSYTLDGQAPKGVSLTDNQLTVQPTCVVAQLTIKVTAAATNNYNAAEQTFTVAVTGKRPASLIVSMDGWTYGETGCGPVYTVPAGVTATVTYAAQGSSDFSETVPTDAGNYTVKVQYETDTEIHTGTAAFTISPKSIEGAEVTRNPSEQVYDGGEKKPAVTSVVLDDNTLTAETDYTVDYENNINATKSGSDSQAKIIITGTGNYTGKVTVRFPINPATLHIDGADKMTATASYGAMVKDIPVSPATVRYWKGKTLAKVPGTWKFNGDGMEDMPEVGNTKEYKAVFTPTSGGENYLECFTYITPSISKAAGYVNAPTAKTNLVYNGEEQELLETLPTSRTGTVQYSLDGKSYTATPPTGKDAGTYTVSYKVVGDKNHLDRAAQSIQVKIEKLAITVTAANKTSRVGQTLAELTYTYTPELAAGDAFTGALTTNANRDAAGSYSITQGNLALNENYTIDFRAGTYTVANKQAQSGFRFESIPSDVTKTYGDADFSAAAAGAAPGSTVTYESSNQTVATVDGTGKVTIKGAGTAVITAKASATEDYEQATATYTLTVGKKSIAIPAADTTVFTYNGTEQTYALAEDGAYTITGNKQTDANETGYAVTVALNDTANTQWADGTTADKTYTFVIGKAVITVKAKDQTAYVGDKAPALGEDSYTVSGLVGDEKLTTQPKVKYVGADGSEITPDMTKTGEVKILASGAAASGNYTIRYEDGKLTVSRRSGGGGGIVIPVQKPEITTGDGGKTDLSDDGTTIKITPDEGKEVDKVLVNGKDIGAVTEVKDLKPGDKVEVIFKDKIKEPTKEELDSKVKEALNDMTLKARSAKTSKKNIRINVIASITDKLPDGYTVKYKYYRSTKKTSGYRLMTAKSENYYINTKGTKGTRYYYKARVAVYDNDGKLIAQTELKQCKYAARVWTKLSKSK